MAFIYVTLCWQDHELVIVGSPTATGGGSEEFALAIHAVYDAYVKRLGIYCWSAVFAYPPDKGGKESQLVKFTLV